MISTILSDVNLTQQILMTNDKIEYRILNQSGGSFFLVLYRIAKPISAPGSIAEQLIIVYIKKWDESCILALISFGSIDVKVKKDKVIVAGVIEARNLLHSPS